MVEWMTDKKYDTRENIKQILTHDYVRNYATEPMKPDKVSSNRY